MVPHGQQLLEKPEPGVAFLLQGEKILLALHTRLPLGGRPLVPTAIPKAGSLGDKHHLRRERPARRRPRDERRLRREFKRLRVDECRECRGVGEPFEALDAVLTLARGERRAALVAREGKEAREPCV